jgi:hypothetical protein
MAAIPRSKLAELGRRHHMSQAALSAVLSEINDLYDETGQIPDRASSSTIKRARTNNVRVDTPYGPLVREVPCPRLQGAYKHITIIHPAALLWYLVHHCVAFSEYFAEQMRSVPIVARARKLSIAMYSDEITLGNVIKVKNTRKVQAIYWAIVQLGTIALQSTTLWFTLSCLRSSLVEDLDGDMSEFMKIVMNSFYDGASNLCTGGIMMGGIMYTASLDILVGDEKSIKVCWACKGSGGNLICLLCRNVVHLKGAAALAPAGGCFCVDASESDPEKFVIHTDESVAELMAELSRAYVTMKKTPFGKFCTDVGFNYVPDGVLMCPTVQPRPVYMTMWDWMHVYMVKGILNQELGLLVSKLHFSNLNLDYRNLHAYLQRFQWPVRVRSVTGKHIFETRDTLGDTSDAKGDASELRSVYKVVQMFFNRPDVLGACEADPTDGNDDLAASIACYNSLCAVIDYLVRISEREAVDPCDLQDAIISHMRHKVNVYGEESIRPKQHHSMHLPEQLARHKILLSCWVHERKHKEIKKYERNLNNTSGPS